MESPSIGSGDLLLRLLRASSLRQRVIASNIANLNTPGYTRQVVRFEELLSGAEGRGPGALASIEPRIEDDLLTPPRADGNNVNLELETAASRQNSVLSELYTTLIQTRLGMIRASIDGGR